MQNPPPNSSASLIYQQQQQVNHDQEQHYHHIPPTTSHLNYNHYHNQHQLQAQELYASAQPQEELYSTYNGGASSYETHVLYNNNHQEILYHESGFVINGSNGVSNHLNSSLSASQTSLPPPPAPADLHDMMMLNNASLLAATGHNNNNHANANNHNSHYFAPQQHQQLQQQGHALRTNGGDDIYGEGLCMVDGGVQGDDNYPETMTVSTRNETCNYLCLLCLSACACFNVLITLLSSE